MDVQILDKKAPLLLVLLSFFFCCSVLVVSKSSLSWLAALGTQAHIVSASEIKPHLGFRFGEVVLLRLSWSWQIKQNEGIWDSRRQGARDCTLRRAQRGHLRCDDCHQIRCRSYGQQPETSACCCATEWRCALPQSTHRSAMGVASDELCNDEEVVLTAVSHHLFSCLCHDPLVPLTTVQ